MSRRFKCNQYCTLQYNTFAKSLYVVGLEGRPPLAVEFLGVHAHVLAIRRTRPPRVSVLRSRTRKLCRSTRARLAHGYVGQRDPQGPCGSLAPSAHRAHGSQDVSRFVPHTRTESRDWP